MKSIFICILLMATSFLTCGQEPKNSPSNTSSHTKEQMRAKAGEEVWIIITYVKDDAKSAFEKWIKEVFYPALHKSKNPMNKAQLNATRWLEPAHQNEDKSYTYVWIMDPIVPNGDYDITALLNTAYGEAKGKEYWDQYQAFWAKPVEAHILKQTGY